MIAFTCESFVKLAQRVVPLDNVGGPILIAQMVGQQAEQGLSAVLLLAALISVNHRHPQPAAHPDPRRRAHRLLYA